ncbi:MAG: hypothetical protein ABSH04_00395 [Acidimicrobiales bacterium]
MRNPLLGLSVLALVAGACGGATGAGGPTTATTGSALLSTTASTTVAVHPATCTRQWQAISPNTSLNPPPARPDLASSVVPPGPTFLTVCRYAGLNQEVEAGTLEQSHVVTGAELAAFVTYVDEPTWQVVLPGTAQEYSCPASEGLVDLLRFVYASGPGVTVSVDLDGCTFVSNGSRTVQSGSIGMRLTPWVGIDRLLQ